MKHFKLYLCVGALAGAFAGGWFANGWRLGAEHTQFRLELAETAERAAQHSLEVERLNITNANLANAKASLEKNLLNVQAAKTAAEVAAYENHNINADCLIDDEWVRLHDLSIEAVPTAGRSDGANGPGRGVPDLGRVLAVVTHNNALCARAVAQLVGWQEWYPTVRCE